MRFALLARVKGCILPAFCLALGFAPLRAATLERLSLDDMIAKSTAIVRGRVTGSVAAFRGPIIYTHYTVQVLDRWKGAVQSTMDVAVPGGTADGYRQIFSGSPQLAQGDEYLLFLWTSRSGLTQIIGLTQGIFQLSKDSSGVTLAVRGASSETMLEPVTGRVVQDQPIQMRLSELGARIATGVGKEVAQ